MGAGNSDKAPPELPPITELKGEREKQVHTYSLPAGVKPGATVLIVAGTDGVPYLSWSGNLPMAGVISLISAGLGVVAQQVAGEGQKPTKEETGRIITLGGRA